MRSVVENRSRKRSALRGVCFRAAAVLLGLSPLLLVEVGLRLAGWRPPTELEDPYIGFSHVRPLFRLNRQTDRYEIAPSRLAYFRPDGFAARKAAREFRIFVLGGSTVQGRPYAIETSFTTWLELSLQAADPSRRWQVVNCGGVSYASYRLAEILREVLGYQPDLIILYTGHNEFLEDRTYHQVKQSSQFVRLGHEALSHLRTYTFCRRCWQTFRGITSADQTVKKTILPEEVDALLDYRGGLKDYHRDDAWRAAVIDHFQLNLYRMVGMASQAGVPVLLVNPVANLKDCPPFKAEYSAHLSEAQRAELDRLWREAKRVYARHPEPASRLLERAVAIDPRHAGVRFHLATCYLMMGLVEEARREFVRAKDEDICPLRILEPMRKAIADVGRATGTPVVDLLPLFQARSRDGIIGDDVMIDHVHPRISMHQAIGDVLLEQLAGQQLVQPRPGWKTRQKALYQAHLRSLPPSYFPKGQQRLEGLRRWTQGRADKIRGPAEKHQRPPRGHQAPELP